MDWCPDIVYDRDKIQTWTGVRRDENDALVCSHALGPSLRDEVLLSAG